MNPQTHPVQHSRWVKPRWKKNSASVGNMPPRTSVDLKFVPAVQLLFLACSTVFLTSKGIPRWYFLRNSCPHELSTASSLGNCQSSVDSKQQITFRPWTTKNFTSTTSSVVFFSSTEESSLGKFPPRILTEIFPVHRGILGGKFLLTDSVGQGVVIYLRQWNIREIM